MALTRRGSGAPPPAEVQVDPYTALAGDDPDARRRAVQDLAGRPEAAETLIALVGHEPDLAVRQAALTAIARYDTLTAAMGLVPYVRGDDAALRTAALEAIATMPTAPAELVPALLGDPDPDVRILTAMLLEELRRPETVAWLAGMLAGDQHPNVVSSALDAFLPLAGAEHIPLLRSVRDRFPADPFIQFTIDAALPGLAGR